MSGKKRKNENGKFSKKYGGCNIDNHILKYKYMLYVVFPVRLVVALIPLVPFAAINPWY